MRPRLPLLPPPAFRRTRLPTLQNLKGSVTFAGVNGLPRTAAPLPKNNFGPRVGVAYQISDKLVLRSGFGLYYSNPNNDFFSRPAGFSTSTNINNSLDSGRTLHPELAGESVPERHQPADRLFARRRHVRRPEPDLVRPELRDPEGLVVLVRLPVSRPPRTPRWKRRTSAAAATT